MAQTSRTVNYWSDFDDQAGGYGASPNLNEIITHLTKQLTNLNMISAFNKSKGSLSLISEGKNQKFVANITDINDALIVVKMIIDPSDNTFVPPAGFSKVKSQLLSKGGGTPEFIDKMVQDFGLLNYLPMTVQKNGITKVANPITNRLLKIGTKTYKKFFQDIQLKDEIFDDEHIFKTIDYNIKDFCVPSFLKKHVSAAKYKKMKIQPKSYTYPELTEKLNSVNIGLNVYVICKISIQEQSEYKKQFNILIHNGHMYLLDELIYNEKLKKLEIDSESFDNLIKNVSSYTDTQVIKNGIRYEKTNDISLIDKDYGYRSTYSQTNINFFTSCNIRPLTYTDYEADYNQSLDINHCFPNILKNETYYFPIINGSEKTIVYNNHPVVEYCFYYCVFNDNDHLTQVLFNKEGWIYGDLLKRLKLDVKILYVHVVNCCDPGKNTHYSNDELVKYSGFLASYETHQNTYFSTNDTNEKEGIKAYLPYSFEQDDKIVISSSSYKHRSGMYAYLAICDYARYQLYLLGKTLNKTHPKYKIRNVNTDSLGISRRIRISKDESKCELIQINKLLEKYDFQVKIEVNKKVDYEYNNKSPFDMQTTILRNNFITKKVYVTPKLQNDFSIDNLIDLLKSNKSFCINSPGGYGKTWNLVNVIIPYLKEHNQDYLISSSTIENSNELSKLLNDDITCIQSHLTKKNLNFNMIIDKFDKYSYIIIDECSQLTSQVLTMLHHIKNHTSCKIILLGDVNQCSSVDTEISWMKTDSFKLLIDYNFIKLAWSQFCRYTEEYDIFLNYIINETKTTCINRDAHIARKTKIMKHVRDFFKDQTKKETTINLVYTNALRKKLTTKTNIVSTVHSYQGKTINEQHTIYEIEKMPYDVLYTALSRTTKKEHVILF